MERFGPGATLLGKQVIATDGRPGIVPAFYAVGVDGSAGSSTATVTSVASATTSTTLLAANADRKGAVIANTDTNALYIHLGGGTASASAYSVSLLEGAVYEVPFNYTGPITGTWAGDGAGGANVTEFE